MSHIVLSQFREALLDGRDRRDEPRARRRVYVDRDGRIVIGDGVEEGERRRLSEIHPAVFA